MMIWRNLDPKVLGQVLVAAAEAFAAKRKAGPHLQPTGVPFRIPLAMAAEPVRRGRPTRS